VFPFDRSDIRATQRIFSHSSRAKNGARAKRLRESWGESKKVKRGGWGRGAEGTLARKPHDSEKPIRPRTGLLIGVAWYI